MPSVTYQDFPEARLIILWGVNPSASGIHLVPYIREAQRRGATLVVIDPRTTPLARQADMHLAVRPGTDLPVALAIHRYLFEEGHADQASSPAHARGAERLREQARAWTFERAAAEAGVAADALAPRGASSTPDDAGADPVRLGPGAQPQRRQRVDGDPGAAGRGRQVRRPRRRLHDEQLGLVGHHRTWIRADEPPTRIVNMNQLGRALTEYTDPPVKCSSSTTRTPAVPRRISAGSSAAWSARICSPSCSTR